MGNYVLVTFSAIGTVCGVGVIVLLLRKWLQGPTRGSQCRKSLHGKVRRKSFHHLFCYRYPLCLPQTQGRGDHRGEHGYREGNSAGLLPPRLRRPHSLPKRREGRGGASGHRGTRGKRRRRIDESGTGIDIRPEMRPGIPRLGEKVRGGAQQEVESDRPPRQQCRWVK